MSSHVEKARASGQPDRLDRTEAGHAERVDSALEDLLDGERNLAEQLQSVDAEAAAIISGAERDVARREAEFEESMRAEIATLDRDAAAEADDLIRLIADRGEAGERSFDGLSDDRIDALADGLLEWLFVADDRDASVTS